MGSAIESFDDSGAVVVPRSRFAPVKTTNDLFVLRSDAYNVRCRPSFTDAARRSACGSQPLNVACAFLKHVAPRPWHDNPEVRAICRTIVSCRCTARLGSPNEDVLRCHN